MGTWGGYVSASWIRPDRARTCADELRTAGAHVDTASVVAAPALPGGGAQVTSALSAVLAAERSAAARWRETTRQLGGVLGEVAARTESADRFS
jgi:hypothetical protein